MSEIPGMIHPEAKFLSSVEPMKPDKLCASKIQWQDKHKRNISIPQGRNRKEGRSDRSQASPKSNKANSIRS